MRAVYANPISTSRLIRFGFALGPSGIGFMNLELQRLLGGGETALAELYSEYRSRLERMVDFRLDHRLRSRIDPADDPAGGLSGDCTAARGISRGTLGVVLMSGSDS